MDKIISSAKNELVSLRRRKLISIIAATILFPLIEAVWISFFDTILPVNPWVFWLPLILFVFLHISFASISLKGAQLVQEVYFEAREIFDENRELSWEKNSLETQIRYLALVHTSAISWRTMQRRYVEKNFDDVEEIDNAIREILAIIVNEREEIFEFTAKELWNFAVYIYNPSKHILKPIWREKHRNHPSEGIGRDWVQGEGHIGKAFVDREPKITSDATIAALSDLMGPTPNKKHPYDNQTYQSFASIPIGPIEEDEDPIGVLVATSNQKGRFNKANCQILRHTAGVLANLIHLNHIERIKILELPLNVE